MANKIFQAWTARGSVGAVPAVTLTSAAFREWLVQNHVKTPEIYLAIRRAGAPGEGATYGEALDHALCFGWIDGVRHSIDARAFSIRFTPRKPGSIWSKVNLKHYERLLAAGRIEAAGKAAFAARDPARSGLYSFESRPREFPAAMAKRFKAQKAAWAYFSTQAPSYQRVCIFWVTSAKQAETQERRLGQLIADCATGRRMKQFAPARE